MDRRRFLKTSALGAAAMAGAGRAVSAPAVHTGRPPNALLLITDQQGALAEWFTRNRDRLRQMVQSRLYRRVTRRVDPSDVLQEAFTRPATRRSKRT